MKSQATEQLSYPILLACQQCQISVFEHTLMITLATDDYVI